MFGLSNQLAVSFVPATELEINRFRPTPFGDVVWHLSTQVTTVVYLTMLLLLTPGGINVGASFPVWFTLWSIRVLLVTSWTWIP